MKRNRPTRNPGGTGAYELLKQYQGIGTRLVSIADLR